MENNVLKLWNYLDKPEQVLHQVLNIPVLPQVESNLRQRNLGQRLARLFKINKNSYPDDLIAGFRDLSSIGIVLYSTMKFDEIQKRLYRVGYPKSGINIKEIKHIKPNKLFETLKTYDVLIVRDILYLPDYIDVYTITKEERDFLLTKFPSFDSNKFCLLSNVVRTDIIDHNLWTRQKKNLIIVGLGFGIECLPSWYRVLEQYATVSLISKDGVVNLKAFSSYVISIGCFIESCALSPVSSIVWHDHLTSLDQKGSLLNLKAFDGKVKISFGRHNLVQITNGVHRYERVYSDHNFNKLLNVSSLVEHIPLFEILASRWELDNLINIDPEVEITLSLIKKVSFWDKTSCEMLKSILVTRVKPVIVFVANKGTYKSSFTNYLADYHSNIGVIDSDDFGIFVTNAILDAGFTSYDSILLKRDCSIFNLYISSRLQVLNGETKMSEMEKFDIGCLQDFDVRAFEFGNFWKRVIKGDYLPNGIDFRAYVVKRMDEELMKEKWFVLCHNHFEARLPTSNGIFSVEIGYNSSETIFIRAIKKNLTLQEYITEMILHTVYQTGIELMRLKIGWGDVVDTLEY